MVMLVVCSRGYGGGGGGGDSGSGAVSGGSCHRI